MLFSRNSLAKFSDYFLEGLQHITLGLDINDLLVQRSQQFPIVYGKSSQNNSLNYLLNFLSFFFFKLLILLRDTVDTEMVKKNCTLYIMCNI